MEIMAIIVNWLWLLSKHNEAIIMLCFLRYCCRYESIAYGEDYILSNRKESSFWGLWLSFINQYFVSRTGRKENFLWKSRVALIFGSFAFHYQENHNLHILIASGIVLIKFATRKGSNYHIWDSLTAEGHF